MKKITVGETEYLAVEVPENIIEFGIEDNVLISIAGAGWTSLEFGIRLPHGNYEIVGLIKDLTQAQIKSIVGNEMWLGAFAVMCADNELNKNDLLIKINPNG